MSEPFTHPVSFGLPEGRRLDEPSDGLSKGVVFNISKFPRATPQRIAAARKNAREVLDENLDRSTDPWTDRETGETYELVREFFNIVDPGASGAVAFTISDGTFSACARRGTRTGHDRSRRQHAGFGMTSQEFRRQRREMARRRAAAAELAAAKAARDEATRRTRAARESATFALQHNLPPERLTNLSQRRRCMRASAASSQRPARMSLIGGRGESTRSFRDSATESVRVDYPVVTGTATWRRVHAPW